MHSMHAVLLHIFYNLQNFLSHCQPSDYKGKEGRTERSALLDSSWVFTTERRVGKGGEEELAVVSSPFCTADVHSLFFYRTKKHNIAVAAAVDSSSTQT